MSLGACLPGLEAEGKLTAEQAAEARALYEERLRAHAASGSRETAEALASEEVLAALTRNVTRKEFLAGLAIKRRAAIEGELRTYGTPTGDARFRSIDGAGGGGPIDPRAAAALIDADPRARYANVEGRRKRIVGDTHRLMDSILTKFSANMLGQVRNKADLSNMVRELFDGGTGDAAAKQLAEAWRRAAEQLRQRFNKAGGDIGFRSDWGLPQSHDWKAVRRAGYEAWRDFIRPRLDPARMVDQRTGLPMTEEGLELALRGVFETIRTNGAVNITPGAPGGRSMANARGDARFLVFKDADSWMQYAGVYGHGTPYDAMMGHIESMARDIAALEVLGPNPEATLRFIKDTMQKEAALDTSPDAKGVERAKSGAKQLDRLWDEYRGKHLEADNETLALVFSSIRSFQVATKLGSAPLSATSDFAFGASRRAFNGLGQASQFTDYIKLMRPGSIEDQKLAIRRGLIAEEFASRTAGQSRYMMEEMTSEWSRRLASGVLRASGLPRHTQAMRWGYGMEALSTYTEQAGKAFGELEPALRGALQRYGIDAPGWDKLRAAPMDTDRGVEWISPHNLPEADRAIGDRFMEMIHTETDMAVPVADLKTRAVFNSKLERGTWLGEIGRSALLFKSFGVSVILRQGAQVLAMQPGTAARYAGGLIIGTTLAGALAIQLKQIAAGRDPRPMADVPFYNEQTGEMEANPGFWGAALLQGGGFGIFGDFMFAAQNRAGSGFAQTLAGPIVDDAQGIVNVATADDPRKSLVREAKGFIPGNNLWYARAAFDRMLADQIDEAINPDIRNARRRLDRYAREQGTAYWWAPGDATPDRAPDFANAFEEGPPE